MTRSDDVERAWREASSPGAGLDDHIYNRLLKDRIIFLGSEVRDDNANAICAQMLLLAAEDPDKDICLYINSPGRLDHRRHGDLRHHAVRPANDIATVGMGLAASMGQFLLSAGHQGQALRHAARPRADAPAARAASAAPRSDIQIQAELILHMKKQLAELTAEQTGKTVEQINADADRDRWFTARGGPGVRLRRPRRRERRPGRRRRRHAPPDTRTQPNDGEPDDEHPTYRRPARASRPRHARRAATSSRSSRSARPTATSARTRTPSCSRTASSSSACRSTTPRPTTSWPSCSCSRARTPTATSSCTSTRPVARSRP